MSLLDRGPHTVTVTPMVTVEDAYGSSTQPGPPIRVSHVFVEPVEASEVETLGLQAKTICRIIGRGPWPGGVNSTIRIDVGPYAGRDFDQFGEHREYTSHRSTAHYDVIITARGVPSH